MPTFTIERTYDVPHFRHSTYEAASLEEALRLDAANQDWESQRVDYDSSGNERITGAWAGGEAYEGERILYVSNDGPAITTGDLGLAIRDFIEGRDVHHFEDDQDKGPADAVIGVDVSDSSNLAIHTETGRKFVVRIFAEG
jgi:hypothetical protein